MNWVHKQRDANHREHDHEEEQQHVTRPFIQFGQPVKLQHRHGVTESTVILKRGLLHSTKAAPSCFVRRAVFGLTLIFDLPRRLIPAFGVTACSFILHRPIQADRRRSSARLGQSDHRVVGG